MLGNTLAPNTRFKTMLCRHWEAYGRCPLGDKCQFAHGEHELRPLPSRQGRQGQGQVQPGYYPSGSSGQPQFTRQPMASTNMQYVPQKSNPSLSSSYGGQRPSSVGRGPYNQGETYSNNRTPRRMIEENTDPVFDNYLRQMQLKEMIELLGQFYNDSRLIQGKLKTARDLTDFGNYDAAGDILSNIIYNPNATIHEKQVFNEILAQTVTDALLSMDRQSSTIELEQQPFYGGTGPGFQYSRGNSASREMRAAPYGFNSEVRQGQQMGGYQPLIVQTRYY
eukprot:TRINITY_DN2555_c0_g1_i27.p1 TRINITY_DN2555_c0_g1~~TRINITY_DN2555_c0_g1_i27.p1  ORF type:complete len:279 (-),score=6.72 TRINITY_DN2555_c0_g1_i27:91-927(-)